MSFAFLLPEIILTAAALTLLLLESFRPVRRGLALGISALALLAGILSVAGVSSASGDPTFHGMISVGPEARFLMVLLMLGVLAVLALSLHFNGFQESDFSWGTFSGLLLLSTAGLLLLTCAADLLLVLIALETVSVTSFILVGFLRKDRRASEAAIKYFLVGAFSTGLLIYGISIVYGLAGTTNLQRLLRPDPAWPALPLAGALFFILVGFGFKLALVPFHMWAPDVYEGAPTPITAFLSIAPKAAGFGVMLHALPNHGALRLTPFLAVLSALTMSVGNLAALRQQNLKRLLAYSSIAQMGYVLMGFVAGGTTGFRSVLIYLAAYLFMNLGAFACVIAVGADAKTETLDGFKGLAGRSLPLALATTVFMLSLTGIPPFVGFIGKFSLFGAVLQSPGLVWLAVAAAVNSVVSFAYYFSLVRAMFFSPPDRSARMEMSPALAGCLGLAALGTVLAGVFPETLLQLVQRAFP